MKLSNIDSILWFLHSFVVSVIRNSNWDFQEMEFIMTLNKSQVVQPWSQRVLKESDQTLLTSVTKIQTSKDL